MITKPNLEARLVVGRQLALANAIQVLDGKIAEQGTGTCLMDTFRFFLHRELIGDGDEWSLIHAIIGENAYGGADEDGDICPAHAHAVMYNKKEKKIYEVSNACRNKENHTRIPFMAWLKLGDVSKVKQYTLEEFGDKMEEYGSLRFFHLEEDDGKHREMLSASTKALEEEKKWAAAAASILEL